MRTAAVAILVASALAGAACGGDQSSPSLEGPAATGRRVWESQCSNCHSVDGDENVGPTWRGIWGTTVALEDGGSAVVDRAYVEESVRDPSAKVVEGFSTPMPAFGEDELPPEELAGVVAYIRSLGDDR
jgi:cytochrome c oxidase subunit 2